MEKKVVSEIRIMNIRKIFVFTTLFTFITGYLGCFDQISPNPDPANSNNTTARFTVTGGGSESFTDESPFYASYDANKGTTIFMGGGTGDHYSITISIQLDGVFKTATFSSGGGSSGVLGISDVDGTGEWGAVYDPKDAANAKGSYSLTITSMGAPTSNSGITGFENPHGTLDATLECFTKNDGPETKLHVDF